MKTTSKRTTAFLVTVLVASAIGLGLYWRVSKPVALGVTPASSTESVTSAKSTKVADPAVVATKPAATVAEVSKAPAPEASTPKAEAEKLLNVDLSADMSVMNAEAVTAEVDSLAKFVDREKAVDRLNAGSVTPSERAAWGQVLERLLALRSRGLKLEIERVKMALESYKAQHEARVKTYAEGKS